MKLAVFLFCTTCAFSQTPAAPPVAPAAPPSGSTVPEDRVVVSVAGMELTKKAFESLIPPTATTSQERQSAADNFARLIQVAQEARNAKFDQDPVQAARLKIRAEQALASAYLVDQMEKMSDEAYLRDWFSRNLSQFSQWKARHILIRIQGSVVSVRKGMKELTDAEALAKAKAVRAKLVSGADFAAVAKLDSDDVGSSSNGGDLGYFSAGQMVAPVEEAITRMMVNEISEPVKTEFGYHVVQLQEVRTKPFEEAKEEIRDKSREELQNRIVDSIRKKYPVTLDPEYFGK